MGVRILLIVAFTALVTIFFIENNQLMELNLWFTTVRMTKSILLPALALSGFILGYIFGTVGTVNRRKRKDLKKAIKLEAAAQSLPPSIQKSISREDEDYLH